MAWRDVSGWLALLIIQAGTVARFAAVGLQDLRRVAHGAPWCGASSWWAVAPVDQSDRIPGGGAAFFYCSPFSWVSFAMRSRRSISSSNCLLNSSVFLPGNFSPL